MNSASATRPRPAADVASTTHINTAAWLSAKNGQLQIGPAPYTAPGEKQIVVRNHAVAINPVDWMSLCVGDLIFPWLTYPCIIGSDVAGEVVAVGPGVSRFKVGDRVLGHAVGQEKARNSPAEGGFQHYTVLLDHMASPIPQHLSYENAAVLPLGLSTAACAMFQKDFLALQYPSAAPTPTGETLLVWGGSTSVGSNAIQLAVAAGYEVITTASPKNFAYVRSLGASLAFDYHSSSVVADIIGAFRGRTLAGAVAIGVGSAGPCVDIARAGKGRKFVAMATPAVSFQNAPRGLRRALWLAPTLTGMIASTAVTTIKARASGVGVKFIWGGALLANEVSRLIYDEFLPRALAEGRYAAAPQALVVGRGLAEIPAALDRQRRGVSAAKVVVSL